jgi:exopolysaccharide biosynthesis polyprenyl glycosylphosphotransferase
MRNRLQKSASVAASFPYVHVVGNGRVANQLFRELSAVPRAKVPYFRRRSALRMFGRRAVRTVVLALDGYRGRAERQVARYRQAGYEVVDAASFAETVLKRVSLSLVFPGEFSVNAQSLRYRLHMVAHEVLSRLCALALLLLTLPLWLFVALAVKLTSEGPVFYTQVRVGLDNRPFRIFKFRTMCRDAEAKTGAVWSRPGDPRVTKVGRILRMSRLDELPQLMNVIRGDMALIGPRPERPELTEQLRKELPLYDVRHRVRPGITGWAQVRAPYASDIDQWKVKLEHDLYYVKNITLWLDLRILFDTVFVVLTGKGAC